MKQEVLPEGTQRTLGRNAQEVNINVGKLIAGIVKTTLGPKGMDKMLVDSQGDVTVTNDGATILKELVIENPTAKMMVEIAKNQEREVGDGTTTAVVIAGELLKNAEALLNKGIHPTIISKGYKTASAFAIQELNNMGVDVSQKSPEELRQILVKVAETAMTGKGSEDSKDTLAEIVVDAVLKVSDGHSISLDDIKVEQKTGGTIAETEIIDGIVLNMTRVHVNMPKKVMNARIALIEQEMAQKSNDLDAKINVSNPDDMQAFITAQATFIKGIVEKVKASNANVLLCGRNINDAAVHYLTKLGVFAVKRIPREDLDKIAKATGGRIIMDIEELTEADLGTANCVEEQYIGGTDMVFVREGSKAKAVTIFVRGSTEQVASEIKRAVEDALGDVATIIRDRKVVGGAGAPEILLSKKIKEYAETKKGREQLAIKAFAEALECIPEALASNAGLDPIDVLADMRSSQVKWPGINVFTGQVMDAWEEGVIEPLKVKVHALNSASEVAIMVLRIDDVFAIMRNPGNLQQ